MSATQRPVSGILEGTRITVRVLKVEAGGITLQIGVGDAGGDLVSWDPVLQPGESFSLGPLKVEMPYTAE